MPYDSQGNFTRLYSWEEDRKNNIDIVSDRHDEEDNNFAQGLNEAFLKDGRTPLEGDIDMSSFKVRNLAEGTLSSDAVNKEQLKNLEEETLKTVNRLVEIGDIKPSALQADHGVWLLCDGREVSREVYALLFDAIGTTFGKGDESTSFNLPDCRGVVVRGFDNQKGFDEAEREFGSYQEDQSDNLSEVGRGYGEYPETTLPEDGTWSNYVSTGSSGSGTVLALRFKKNNRETRMKNIALNYFIKVKEEENVA